MIGDDGQPMRKITHHLEIDLKLPHHKIVNASPEMRIGGCGDARFHRGIPARHRSAKHLPLQRGDSDTGRAL